MGGEDDLRRKAEEAERQSLLARSEEDRKAFRRIAEGWRALLAQAEARNRRGGV